MVGDVSCEFFAEVTNFDGTVTLFLPDAIDPAARQLRFGGEVEHSILKARRAEIGNENDHGG
jgi:hypothetical protein